MSSALQLALRWAGREPVSEWWIPHVLGEDVGRRKVERLPRRRRRTRCPSVAAKPRKRQLGGGRPARASDGNEGMALVLRAFVLLCSTHLVLDLGDLLLNRGHGSSSGRHGRALRVRSSDFMSFIAVWGDELNRKATTEK